MDPLPQQITTITTQPETRTRMLPAELPPGVELVTLPGGVRTLAYTGSAPPPAPAPSTVQPIPAWAKTTALLAPTVGGGVGAAGVGLSYAAPGLIAMTEALWAAVVLLATGALATLALKWGAGRSGGSTGPAHVTQHITASGLFGRASGTIHH